jgi:MFS superfamily sulfate permease-like transporter
MSFIDRSSTAVPGKLWPTTMADIKQNFISGFTIFLIALPLSIGISVASGAPPTAGILAAIVGGIVGSIVSGSYVTISGPAAGMIVVMLECVDSLGKGDVMQGFKITLAAIAVAGFVQIVLGLLKAGTIGLAVPVNALHGMLSSIGVTIIVKQMFVLGGIKPTASTTFLQIPEIFQRLGEDNYEVMLIGAICLVTVIIISKIKAINKYIPAPLAAVIVGYIASHIADLEHPHVVTLMNSQFEIGPKYLLHVPEKISEYMLSPLFQDVFSGTFIKCVITIMLVSSIESLLSTYAVDKLDPLKRSSNLNMDLISKGICNMILGFIGGIPVISEIVRSSANVATGATSRWSNLFHGVLILIFIIFATSILNTIPLTAFAAILIFVGYRLANPAQLKHVLAIGKDQLLVFVVTLVVTLNTDLLVGIFVGTALELAINAFYAKSFTALFKAPGKLEVRNEDAKIAVLGPCVFSNMLYLKGKIEKCTAKNVEVDFRNSPFVDYSSKEILLNVQRQMGLVNKHVTFTGIEMPTAHH